MANKVNVNPILPFGFVVPELIPLQQAYQQLVRSVFAELKDHATRVNNAYIKDGTELATGPVRLASYTVATVPDATLYTGGMVYVSDETGGAIPAFSDGTNWRRVTDRAVVS